MLSLEIVYADSDLVELRGRLIYGAWSGLANAYTTASEINQFALSLGRLSDNQERDVSFQAGEFETGGAIALRFYRYDSAGHIACHVRLAKDVPTDYRPEEIFRLTVEAKTETALIDKFVQDLQQMLEKQCGASTLQLV